MVEYSVIEIPTRDIPNTRVSKLLQICFTAKFGTVKMLMLDLVDGLSLKFAFLLQISPFSLIFNWATMIFTALASCCPDCPSCPAY